ncbi:hypothetical protein [Rhodopila sp.]|uniref:hypothetical protein n=1 Tax=Rhodopila sp. TaxID=2480087 RepID=UPI003D0A97D1
MQTAIAERAEAEGQHGASLLESAAELRSKAMCLLRQAEEAGDLKTALVGVREASRTIELMAKLSGQLDDSVKLNIVMAPALIELQTIVLSALADHPAARMAVAAALGNLAAPSMPAMIEYRPQP